jgi:hypothetical protein
MFRRAAQADPFDPFDAPDRPSARDEVLAMLQPWVAAHRRPAWRPLVAPGEPSGTRSEFCGQAWLLPGEAPPTCTDCGHPLQLFVQLDLGELPGELDGRFGEDILQLFYCVDDDCPGDGAWEAFSDVASLVRVVPPTGGLAPASEPDPAFRPLAITGWEPFDDAPDPEDHELAGLSAAYDFALRTVTLRCPEVGLQATLALDDLGVEEIAQAAGGDKLAGWPSWVQFRDYPHCPTCGRTMRVVFQLDSEDHVPFMFGDTGVGHITQCPTHPTTVAFAWSGS